jgi:hypothetical protein
MQTARKPYIVKKAEELCEIINGIIALPKSKHWNQLSDDLLELVNLVDREYPTLLDFKKAFNDRLITCEQFKVIERFVTWGERLGLYD